jgi:hypothetical protein
VSIYPFSTGNVIDRSWQGVSRHHRYEGQNVMKRTCDRECLLSIAFLVNRYFPWSRHGHHCLSAMILFPTPRSRWTARSLGLTTAGSCRTLPFLLRSRKLRVSLLIRLGELITYPVDAQP